MKNVVITGCNRGLGLNLLNTFAKNNYNIVACVRAENNDFTDWCHRIEQENGIKITPLYFDMTDKEQLIQGMEELLSLNMEIDVLINNAAICILKPQLFTEYEEVENSFKVNYFAPFLITKMISSLMMQKGSGSIINISSAGSLGHQPGGSCYDASKAALNQLTVSLAQELAAFNIRVNAVAPGPMQTEMFENMDEKVKKKLVKYSALKRPATLDDVSKTVLFLCSEDASYITGQVLRVDGGSIL